MATVEMSLMTAACGHVETLITSDCRNHVLGHICNTIADADTCSVQMDIAVALEYCQGAGSPQQSVLGMCQNAASATQSILDMCNVVGVGQVRQPCPAPISSYLLACLRYRSTSAHSCRPLPNRLPASSATASATASIPATTLPPWRSEPSAPIAS